MEISIRLLCCCTFKPTFNAFIGFDARMCMFRARVSSSIIFFLRNDASDTKSLCLLVSLKKCKNEILQGLVFLSFFLSTFIVFKKITDAMLVGLRCTCSACDDDVGDRRLTPRPHDHGPNLTPSFFNDIHVI